MKTKNQRRKAGRDQVEFHKTVILSNSLEENQHEEEPVEGNPL